MRWRPFGRKQTRTEQHGKLDTITPVTRGSAEDGLFHEIEIWFSEWDADNLEQTKRKRARLTLSESEARKLHEALTRWMSQ